LAAEERARRACQYVQADIREPGKILAEAARTLDFSQPVAVMILMTLQYVPDADDPHQIVRTLMDAMPPGATWRYPTWPKTWRRTRTSRPPRSGSTSDWDRYARPSAARGRS